MSGTFKIDLEDFEGDTIKMKAKVDLAMRAVMQRLARAGRDLARARIPANMDPKRITAKQTPLGPAIAATGGPAAYDGGRVKKVFSHPIFASQNIPRSKWNWQNDQPTHPFIEESSEEIMSVGTREIEIALQRVFDTGDV